MVIFSLFYCPMLFVYDDLDCYELKILQVYFRNLLYSFSSPFSPLSVIREEWRVRRQMIQCAGLFYTVKKDRDFPVLSRDMSLTELSLAGNNLIIPGQGEFG